MAPFMKFDFPDFLAELGQDPSPPVLAHGIVFVDGSCFIHDWARVRAASSAVFIPNQLEWVMSLPGSFLTSQRAEIFSVAMAMYATTGPLVVASDCSNVVRMFAFLAKNLFQPIALKAAANKDLWSLVIELARRRDAPGHVCKVKAHVSNKDPQDPHLTFANSKVDLLAKKHAWRVFEQCSEGCCARISEAFALQAHMVSAVQKRANLLKLWRATDFELHGPSLGMGPFCQKIHCTCTSAKRCRTKTKVCQGCHLSETRGCLESVAISEHHARGITSLTLDLLRAIPLFHQNLFSERIAPINVRLPGDDQIHRKGRPAPAEVEEIIRFTQQCQVMFSRRPAGPCVPWTLVSYDFCSMFPQSSLVTQYPTLHRAVCAFRSLFAQILKCGGCKVITAPNCTHFKPLGLGKVAGFFGSFCPRSEGACWFGVPTRALEGGSSHKFSPSKFAWYLP